jgi:Xaa-Pro aminopeptidase
MEPKEIKWLNNYHKLVEEKLSPYLNTEEKMWLKAATRPI